MTKDILVTIEGMQLGPEENPVVVKADGTYSFINGDHFIRYEERLQEDTSAINNLIKISALQVSISKKGAIRAQMVFDTKEMTKASYHTSYGNLNFDIETKSIILLEEEDKLQLKMEYSLSSANTPLSDNIITVTAEFL